MKSHSSAAAAAAALRASMPVLLLFVAIGHGCPGAGAMHVFGVVCGVCGIVSEVYGSILMNCGVGVVAAVT